MSKLKQVNQSGYNKGYLAGRRDSAERIAELEHDIDQYREIDKDHLKRIEVLEELVEMSYLHSDIRLHTEWFKRYKAFKGEAK